MTASANPLADGDQPVKVRLVRNTAKLTTQQEQIDADTFCQIIPTLLQVGLDMDLDLPVSADNMATEQSDDWETTYGDFQLCMELWMALDVFMHANPDAIEDLLKELVDDHSGKLSVTAKLCVM